MARRVQLSPGLIPLAYLGLLLATVGGLVVSPFSRPLTWLLFLLLGISFLFDFAVIALSLLIIVA